MKNHSDHDNLLDDVFRPDSPSTPDRMLDGLLAQARRRRAARWSRRAAGVAALIAAAAVLYHGGTKSGGSTARRTAVVNTSPLSPMAVIHTAPFAGVVTTRSNAVASVSTGSFNASPRFITDAELHAVLQRNNTSLVTVGHEQRLLRRGDAE